MNVIKIKKSKCCDLYYLNHLRKGDNIPQLTVWKDRHNILIGDIIYEANEYETRPEYGFHMVSYDPEKKCKIYRFNEGMPLIKEKQALQLKKNNIVNNCLISNGGEGSIIVGLNTEYMKTYKKKVRTSFFFY